jgi:energy-coupling factor transport system ATP-binding protein
MIRVEGVSFSYPPLRDGEPRLQLFNNLSFEVGGGECLAISGPSGSGKTTLCMALAGLAPRLTGGKLSGKIVVDGRDVQAEAIGSLADVVGLALEEPTGQLFCPTIADEVAWGLENLGVPHAEMPVRIERALEMVGLHSIPYDQPPQTLSGGQQKRLVLATALTLEPQVLVLDHPSSGLSPAARAEMIGVLQTLRDRHGLTLVISESDPDIVLRLATRLAILENGAITLDGPPREIVYKRIDHGSPPIVKFARSLAASERAIFPIDEEDAAHQLRNISRKKFAARRSKGVSTETTPIIEVENISFHYPGGPKVLDNLSLTLRTGEFVALVGENGSGKTTLARNLIGLARPAHGCIRVMGKVASDETIAGLAIMVGFAFQNPEMQIFNATTREEVETGLKARGVSGDTLKRKVEQTLDDFGLTEMADAPPAMLSLSGRRLVALAGIAALHTPIIVLDEPTIGLDRSTSLSRVLEWLVKRHEEGATVLLITHDMELVARYAERVLVMAEGRLLGDGTPVEIFSQPSLLSQAGLVAPFAFRLAQAMKLPELGSYLTPEGAAQAIAKAMK